MTSKKQTQITMSVDNILFQYQITNAPKQKNTANPVTLQGSTIIVHQKVARDIDFLLNKYLWGKTWHFVNNWNFAI